jgi:hypothetical protein
MERCNGAGGSQTSVRLSGFKGVQLLDWVRQEELAYTPALLRTFGQYTLFVREPLTAYSVYYGSNVQVTRNVRFRN